MVVVQRIRNVGWFIDCNRRPKLADDRAIRYDGSTLIADGGRRPSLTSRSERQLSAAVVPKKRTPFLRVGSMTRAQRLKPLASTSRPVWSASGRLVSSPASKTRMIKQILAHLKHKAESGEPEVLPESRVPPAELHHGLFDCER